jgi:hypothetical protein
MTHTMILNLDHYQRATELVTEQREIVILSGRQLRSLNQHKLDILVALFGNRCANRLLG